MEIANTLSLLLEKYVFILVTNDALLEANLLKTFSLTLNFQGNVFEMRHKVEANKNILRQVWLWQVGVATGRTHVGFM